MKNSYTVELTGKQIALLCNCIDERIKSNNQISKYTNQNLYHKNRTLLGLQRYLRNIKDNKHDVED